MEMGLTGNNKYTLVLLYKIIYRILQTCVGFSDCTQFLDICLPTNFDRKAKYSGTNTSRVTEISFPPHSRIERAVVATEA